MSRRLYLGALTLAVAALIAPLATSRPGSTESSVSALETGRLKKLPFGLATKFAAMATFSPGAATLLEEAAGGTGAQDWLEHATPGTDIPYAAFAGARGAWRGLKARPAVGGGAWTPLGPVYGKSADNPFRDRTVYNAGTDNFSGRSIAAAIDPNCVVGNCRLWLANANGGVWMTRDVLAAEPAWEFVSHTFEHNNVAEIILDPNDPSADTLWAGTGEPNACGSGCTAGVGLYKSSNGGKSWKGPIGSAQFAGRAVGSIAVQPGNPDVVFAASGRGVLGVSNTCCGGVDALIPGAPHFGLYRSVDGGNNWQLVNQGAPALCTASTPDDVSLNLTPCAPRGARRVMFDPVDPNTVYVSFLSRGIWRSRDLGNTWEQIMPLLGSGTAERAEFDVVQLGAETRMYVGVGGGGLFARFRRNDAVRLTSAATALAGWIDLTSSNVATNPAGYSSFGYCDGQCSYDNDVYVPPGAGPDTVYLLGDYEYNENNNVSGRSNGRGILLSTNAGVHFTDMTEDASDNVYPVQAHPDHHAIVTNPGNWQQFFDLGDGGIIRSNGNFVDDSGDCDAVKGITNAARLAFCRLVLARIPERLEPINKGLRTLHFYQIEYNKANPDIITGGTQDNGSWETVGGDTWLNTNIADGGHNAYDALGGNPDFRLTAWQQGQLEVSFTPQNQTDVTWVSDTMFVFYGNELVPFIGNAITDPVQPGTLWHGREHVFRSGNHGLNPAFPRADVLAACNVWTGNGDVDGNGVYEATTDICDGFRPLGDPGTNGRLTAPVWGDRSGGSVAVVERAKSDSSTLWVATSLGRVFVSKNADAAVPASVQFTRLDSLAGNDPPRYPTSIFVDPEDANHAWITYSGFNVKTPATPGHVFEVRYVPATGAVTFTNLDGHKNNGFGDIPATSVIVSPKGTLYVGHDFGVAQKQKNSPVWHSTAAGLPNVTVSDLVYLPERGVLYAGTHGQGVWRLKVH
jgi:hypothetical protein